MFARTAAGWVLVCLGACVLPACGVVSTAAGVAGTGFSAVQTLFTTGKNHSYVNVSLARATAEAQAAADDLDLTALQGKALAGQQRLVYQDRRDQTLTVTLIARTPRVTEVRVDVGLLGNTGMGKLLLNQILACAGDATHTKLAAGG